MKKALGSWSGMRKYLEDEMLTPHPILSDDYTAHDVTKLDETIEKADENEKIIEESLKTSQDK